MAQTIKLKRSATSGAIPSTSNLALGEVAINTYDGKMYIKKDVGGTETVVEVGASAVYQYTDAGMVEYEYTASANDTTFSGSDNNSATLIYETGSILVFLNGVLQDDGTDYTATNGTSVVFTNALAASDEVRIISVTSAQTLHNPTKLDTITTVNNQAAYTMQLSGNSYTPSNENALIVSINGITQEPGDSFTVSGSTITFSPALVTGDVVDYIIDFGRSFAIPDLTGDFTVDSPTFHVDSTNNRVGVGTITPGEALEVVGNIELSGEVIGDLQGDVTGTVSSIANHSTTNLSEGTNLYHTTERVQDVTGGQFVTNGTHTGISFAYDDANDGAIDATVSLASFDTDDLSEGSTNLYYTDARVDSRLSSGSVGNIVTTGYIAGPSTFTIDPAAVGDNTGTLVVAGNLQVDGTTTTINSTTMTVDDLNITLASGAANAAAANGAGITVDGASATITYNSTPDAWSFNKNVGIGTASPSYALHVYETPGNGAYSDTTNMVATSRFHSTEATTGSYTAIQLAANNGNSALGWWNIGTVSTSTNYDNHLVFQTRTGASTYAERMRITSGGRVGINETNPDQRLHVTGTTSDYGILAEQPSGYAGLSVKSTTVNQTWSFLAQDNGSNSDLALYGGSSAGIKMTVNHLGNVGIGVPNPDAPLHVKVTEASTGETDPLVRFERFTTGDNHYLDITLDNSTNMVGFQSTGTSNGGFTFGGASNDLLIINSSGAVGIGTSPSGADLHLDSNGTNVTFRLENSTNDNGYIQYAADGTMRFYTGAPGGSTNIRAYITSDGDFGIGTSPSAKLDVNGTAVFGGDTTRLTTYSDSTYSGIFNGSSLTSDEAIYMGADSIFFYGGGTERIRIDSSGRVGIGGFAPSYSLHISEGATTDIVAQSSGANGTRAVMAVDNTAMYLGTAYSSSNVPLYFGAGWTGSDLASKFMTITAAGLVGVGTEGPERRLHVSTGNDYIAKFESTDAFGGIILEDSNSTTDGNVIAVTGDNMKFYTANALKTIITSAGEVGIGIPNPQRTLHINGGATRTDVQLTLDGYGETSADGVQFGILTTGSYIWNFENTDLYFATNNTRRLTIAPGGNVGIGEDNPVGPLHIKSATNRTLTLDGTFPTGSFTWLSVKRSTTEKWRWFLEADDDVTLYGDVNSVGGLMRWSSDGQVYINRSSSISGGTSSKLCISGNIDIDGNPGSTNVIRLYQSATEMGQLYAHTTGVRSYLFSGNAFSIKGQADATFKLVPGSGVYNSSLQWLGNTDQIAVEGFEIWYDNDVGDVHLNTTYNHDNAAIRFHTKTAAGQSEVNERFTIAGNGNIGINEPTPFAKFTIDNNGATAHTFFADVGNFNDTQTLFTHTGANTPVPFRISKSGYTGNSQAFGIMHFHMNHSTTGGGSNLHFTLLDSASTITEYGGIGAQIVDNTNGSEDGRLNFYVTQNSNTRQNKMYLTQNGALVLDGSTAGEYVLDVDGNSFQGRMARLPGRFIIGPNGNSYPEIGYNFIQTTGNSTNTKQAGDTSYKINFGTGGKFTFSSSGSGTAGSNITWTDVMTITNGAFVGIGSNATSPVSPLTVHAQQNNYGPITARTGNYTTQWSILPWSVGNTYISSGIYYANSNWVHASPGTYNCLFDIGGSGGIRWYASDNSTSSWNLASNVQLFNNAGQLTASSASDERLKDNVVDYSIANALTKVNALRPVSFEWNETIKSKKGIEYSDGTHIGFIAQEVELIYPEACLISDVDEYDADSPFDMDPDATYYGDIKGVRAEKMVPILVGELKQLTRRLEILENA